jgi:hypothetical protein
MDYDPSSMISRRGMQRIGELVLKNFSLHIPVLLNVQGNEGLVTNN